MPRKLNSLGIVALTSSFTACNLACGSADGSYGLIFVVADSVTQTQPKSNVQLTARAGTYVENKDHSTDPKRPLLYVFAAEKPGVYSGQLVAEGYKPWTFEGERVREGSCGYPDGSKNISVRLQPLSE